MSSTALWVDDMHCGACSSKIKLALNKLPGVEQVQINPIDKQVHVQHTASLLAQDIVQSIESAGFHPTLASLKDHNQSNNNDQTLLKRTGIAGICMMQIMMLQIAMYAGAFDTMSSAVQSMLSYIALLFCLPVVCYAATPFFVRGLAQPLRKTGNLLFALNMDTPIASAILLAFAVSLVNTINASGDIYFDSVAMFAFLMLATRYIDQRLRGQLTLEKSLLSNLPAEVQVLTHGKISRVSIKSVKPGQHLWVAAGAMIPTDGQLISDRADIDEALLTGEVEPVTHKTDEPLYAGTLNVGAGFTMLATKAVDATRLADMDQIAQAAASQKPTTLQLTDTIARIFVPSILLLACLTYVGWSAAGSDSAIETTLAVLIISCPCALSLAVPAAINAGLGRLRRAGVLVKNPAALERADKITHVYFDKTGTLTHPRAQLVNTHLIGQLDQQTCLQLAAAVQVHSPHPIARAFQQYLDMPAERVAVVPGQGVEGWVEGRNVRIGKASFSDAPHLHDPVVLSVDRVPQAVFEVIQPVREDAPALVQRLKQLGLSLRLISGDQEKACHAVADQLQIECAAGVDPYAKQRQVSDQPTLFVGDGLNDLMAMSSAPVSIATMETVDLVKSKADVLLMSSQLAGVAELIGTGHLVQRIIRQNLTWALLYNLIAIPAAISGLAPPWLAAAGMSASSLLVLGNAMRVLRIKAVH